MYHQQQQPQQQLPNNGVDPRCDSSPLPPGWEMKIDDRINWPYFINHNDRSTTYNDPRRMRGNPQQQPTQSTEEVQQQNAKQPRVIPVQHHTGGYPPQQLQTGGYYPQQHPSGFTTNNMNYPQQQQQHFPQPHGGAAYQRGYPQQGVATPQQSRSIPIQVMHSNPASRSSTPTRTSTPTHRTPSNTAHYSAQPTVPTKPTVPTAPTKSQYDHRVVKALADIEEILKDLPELEAQVAAFQGNRSDKNYLKIEDQLTKKLLKLDGITASDVTNGGDVVRTNRKSAVKQVQQIITSLEQKATE